MLIKGIEVVSKIEIINKEKDDVKTVEIEDLSTNEKKRIFRKINKQVLQSLYPGTEIEEEK